MVKAPDRSDLAFDRSRQAENLKVGDAAAHLGVARTTLSKVLNGRAAMRASMALRIERWLGRDDGGAAEVWLAQDTAHDLWQAGAAASASNDH